MCVNYPCQDSWLHLSCTLYTTLRQPSNNS